MARRDVLICLLVALVATGCGRRADETGTKGPAMPTAAPMAVAPPTGARFDYQIGGAYPPAGGVGIVDRDRADPPVPGRYNICYVNAFQAQQDEIATWRGERGDLLLHDASGRVVLDTQWDEPLFDISSDAKRARLATIVGGWIDACARAGYQAVEADNLDSWTRSAGRLDADDAAAFASLLAEQAHRLHLAIGQKNAAELLGRAAEIGFDFAITEECEAYAECERYTAVYGARVLEIEYTDDHPEAFARACTARGSTISIVQRDRDVLPSGRAGYVSRYC